eukprot:g4298.t1
MATRFVNLEQLLQTSAHSTQHAGGNMSWNYSVPRGRTAFQSIFDGLSAARESEADSIADEKKSDSNFDAGMKDDLNGNPLNNGNPLLKRSKPDAPRAHSAHPGEDALVDPNSEQMDSEEMASYLGAGQPARADQRLVGVNSGPDDFPFSVSTNGRGSPAGGLNGVDNGSIGNRLQENRDLLSVPAGASASSSKTKSEPEASNIMGEVDQGEQDAGEAKANSAGKSKSSRRGDRQDAGASGSGEGEQSADAGGSAEQQAGQKRKKDDDDDDDSNQQGPFDEDEQGESNKASGGPRGGDEDGRRKAGARAKSDGSQGDDDDADPGSGGAAAATGRGNKDHPRAGTSDHPGSRSGNKEGQMWSKLFGSDAGGHQQAPKGEEGSAEDGSDATEVFAAPNADDTQHEVFVQDGQQKRPHQQGAQEKPNGAAEDHEDVTVVTDSARPEDPPLAVIVTEDENENGVPPAALLSATGKRTNAPAGMGENWFAPPVPRAVARDQEELPPIASWSSPGSLIGTALCLGAQAYLGAYIFARYLRKPEEEDGGAEGAAGAAGDAEDPDQVPEDEHEADDPAQDYVTVSMRDVGPPSAENQVTAASPGAGGRTGSGSASAGEVGDGDKKKGGHSLSGTFASKSPVGTSPTGGKEGQQGTVRLYTPRAVVEGGDTTEPEEVVVAQDEQEAETLGKTGLATHQQHLPDPDGERAQPGAELASDNQLAVSGGLVVLHTSSETEALGTSIETIEKAEEQFSAKKDDAAAAERASLAPSTTNVEDALPAEGAATQVSLVAAQTQRETKSAAVASETESTTSGATGSSYVDVGNRTRAAKSPGIVRV